jgi:GntR family transcriptional regulator
VALAERSLYELLRERGVRPHSADPRLGAKAASDEEAALLGLASGSPLVTMRRVMRDDTGRPVEVGDHVYDAAHYAVELPVFAT